MRGLRRLLIKVPQTTQELVKTVEAEDLLAEVRSPGFVNSRNLLFVQDASTIGGFECEVQEGHLQSEQTAVEELLYDYDPDARITLRSYDDQFEVNTSLIQTYI